MIRLFKVQGQRQPQDPVLNFPACPSESKLPSIWTIIASTLALIGVLIGWSINSGSTIPATTPIPEVPQRLQDLGSSNNQAIEPIPTASSQSKNNIRVSSVAYGPYLPQKTSPLTGKGIEVRVVQNSWVEIRSATGKTLVSRVLKKGEKYLIPKKEGLTMTIGNAGGIQFYIDGQNLRPVGQTGQVIRRLPLDITYLQENFSL